MHLSLTLVAFDGHASSHTDEVHNHFLGTNTYGVHSISHLLILTVNNRLCVWIGGTMSFTDHYV